MSSGGPLGAFFYALTTLFGRFYVTDVYIAEGHGRRPDGTFDPGATDGIHSEQRDSKPVAEAATRILRSAGLTVFSEAEEMDDPNYRGTTARANDMGPECIVSFHYDWLGAPPGAFAIATSDDGRELGWAIEDRVAEAGFDIRDYPDDRDGLYLLDNTTMPAVIFECGRIGHEYIDETPEQRAMGEAAAFGILDWLGVEDMPLTQEDKDWIVAAIRSDNIDQTNSVWKRHIIRDSAGNQIPLLDALQFIYRRLEQEQTEPAELSIELTGTAKP